MRPFSISPLDLGFAGQVQHKIDNLNKPKGSLGRLEGLALQLSLIQHTLTPSVEHRCHLLFGADHGIECEGVSPSPREVTWQQMRNFAQGGGGVNVFCRQHGVRLFIVDVGVDADLSDVPSILPYKVARGTDNFLYGPALTSSQFDEAVEVGTVMVDRCREEGCDILSIGEMGIGNTSPSSIWLHLLAGVDLGDCVGAGAGLDGSGISHKLDVLRRSVEHWRVSRGSDAPATVEEIVTWFGGLEMVAALGAMLRAAECDIALLVDGFIMSAVALAACRLYPSAQQYMIFSHCGDERAHALLLQKMNARPLLNLGLRLGEGTGALCALPLVDSAVRMINEMNNFDDAHITKYF